jgi:predicted lipid-binding transport protein (Tim44 family)
LLDEFKVLRAQQPDDIHTRVDEVHVQVIAWDKEQDQWVLTVRFSGYIAEEAGAFPHAFTEYWHLLRIGEADGEWRLAGIQQA